MAKLWFVLITECKGILFRENLGLHIQRYREMKKTIIKCNLKSYRINTFVMTAVAYYKEAKD